LEVGDVEGAGGMGEKIGHHLKVAIEASVVERRLT